MPDWSDNIPPPTPQTRGSSGGIFRLAELAFTQLRELDRDRTAVIFSVSPLEEHGPHLPVGTDLFDAEFFSERLAERIVAEKAGWTVLLGPPVPLGASAFDEPGTLRARARTVRNLAVDYGGALARHGFRYILLMNGHGGPRHIVALEEAAAAVSRRYAVRMLSLSGPILWQVLRGEFTERLEGYLGRPLTAEEREGLRGDAHAGLWETSLILRIRPELVSPEFTRLPAMRFPLLDALRHNYPLRLGNQQGYIGSPAPSSREFGEVASRVLTDAGWEIARPIFDAPDERWQQTSLLYKVPFLRSGFPFVAGGLAILLGLGLIYWLWH
jgi:creatinine amidohydrolase